jgi:hypothetical protein
MMEETYPTKINQHSGRAHIEISGEINATKIRNTFLALTMNESWLKGDRSILWQIKDAYFPEPFEFSDIFKTTQNTAVFAGPGKSAVVVEKSSEMQKRVADFYKSIAATTTDRKIELFDSKEKAMVWLDTS